MTNFFIKKWNFLKTTKMKYNPEIFLLILVSARWIHALNSLVAPAQKFSFSKGSWCSRGSTCRRPRRMPGNPSLELALPPSSPRLRRQNRQLRSHGRRSPQRADPGLTYHPTQVPVHLNNPCFRVVSIPVIRVSKSKSFNLWKSFQK